MSDPAPPTERRNLLTADMDSWASASIVDALIEQDRAAIDAAASAAGALAEAVDRAVAAIAAGGSVHYFGAGASGRLAFLDATEVGPTFSAPPEMFVSHFPGGAVALLDSTIDLEDAEALGIDDAVVVGAADFVIGISASGTTAYVRGALRSARDRGAGTALVTSDPDAALAELADILIASPTGAEAVTGSTRLKAGTATKVLLNAFSTTVMIRLGATYSNLMVRMKATNAKLDRRAVRVLEMASSASIGESERALIDARGDVPLALVHLLSGEPLERCRPALEGGRSVRTAVDLLRG